MSVPEFEMTHKEFNEHRKKIAKGNAKQYIIKKLSQRHKKAELLILDREDMKHPTAYYHAIGYRRYNTRWTYSQKKWVRDSYYVPATEITTYTDGSKEWRPTVVKEYYDKEETFSKGSDFECWVKIVKKGKKTAAVNLEKEFDRYGCAFLQLKKSRDAQKSCHEPSRLPYFLLSLMMILQYVCYLGFLLTSSAWLGMMRDLKSFFAYDGAIYDAWLNFGAFDQTRSLIGWITSLGLAIILCVLSILISQVFFSPYGQLRKISSTFMVLLPILAFVIFGVSLLLSFITFGIIASFLRIIGLIYTLVCITIHIVRMFLAPYYEQACTESYDRHYVGNYYSNYEEMYERLLNQLEEPVPKNQIIY